MYTLCCIAHTLEKDRCQKCNGQKVVRDRKILEVHIEKGMKDGQKIVFRGESNQVRRLNELYKDTSCIGIVMASKVGCI